MNVGVLSFCFPHQTRDKIATMYDTQIIYDSKKDTLELIHLYTKYFSAVRVNPLTAKVFNLNFHPLEVVSR